MILLKESAVKQLIRSNKKQVGDGVIDAINRVLEMRIVSICEANRAGKRITPETVYFIMGHPNKQIKAKKDQEVKDETKQ
jgi:hypothetical protein